MRRPQPDHIYMAILRLRGSGFEVRRLGNKHVVNGVKTTGQMLLQLAALARDVRAA